MSEELEVGHTGRTLDADLSEYDNWDGFDRSKLEDLKGCHATACEVAGEILNTCAQFAGARFTFEVKDRTEADALEGHNSTPDIWCYPSDVKPAAWDFLCSVAGVTASTSKEHNDGIAKALHHVRILHHYRPQSYRIYGLYISPIFYVVVCHDLSGYRVSRPQSWEDTRLLQLYMCELKILQSVYGDARLFPASDAAPAGTYANYRMVRQPYTFEYENSRIHILPLHRGTIDRKSFVGIAKYCQCTKNVVPKEAPDKFIIKFENVDTRRQRDERDVLRALQGIPGVVELVPVAIKDAQVMPDTCTSSRLRVVQIIAPTGDAFAQCVSVNDFFKTIFDLVETHRAIMKKGWAHRDASWSNCMLSPKDYLVESSECYIENLLNPSPSSSSSKIHIWGLWTDFGCAGKLGTAQTLSGDLDGKTACGTWMFMPEHAITFSTDYESDRRVFGKKQKICLGSSPSSTKSESEDIFFDGCSSPIRQRFIDRLKGVPEDYTVTVDNFEERLSTLCSDEDAEKAVKCYSGSSEMESLFYLVVLFFLRVQFPGISAGPKYELHTASTFQDMQLRKGDGENASSGRSLSRRVVGWMDHLESHMAENPHVIILKRVAFPVLKKLCVYFSMPWIIDDWKKFDKDNEATFHAHNYLQAVILHQILDLKEDIVQINAMDPLPIKGLPGSRHVMTSVFKPMSRLYDSTSDIDRVAKRTKLAHGRAFNTNERLDGLTSPCGEPYLSPVTSHKAYEDIPDKTVVGDEAYTARIRSLDFSGKPLDERKNPFVGEKKAHNIVFSSCKCEMDPSFSQMAINSLCNMSYCTGF